MPSDAKHLSEVLQKLGLSRNEATVYLSLLTMKPSTGFEIARVCGLFRPNVYDALKKLVQKGLVSYSLREKARHYSATDPNQLLNMLPIKESELAHDVAQLRALRASAPQVLNVEILEGQNGVHRILTDMVNETPKGGAFYVFGAPKETAKVFGEGWLGGWHKQHVKKHVTFHHIVNEDYPIHRIKLLRKMPYVTIRFLPKKYNAPILTVVYDKGIILIFLKPLLAIKLTDPLIAQAYHNYFNLLLRMAMPTAPQERKK